MVDDLSQFARKPAGDDLSQYLRSGPTPPQKGFGEAFNEALPLQMHQAPEPGTPLPRGVHPGIMGGIRDLLHAPVDAFNNLVDLGREFGSNPETAFGHLAGGSMMGIIPGGATTPVWRSPITIGEPRIPEVPPGVGRYIPGHETLNLPSLASRIRFEKPVSIMPSMEHAPPVWQNSPVSTPGPTPDVSPIQSPLPSGRVTGPVPQRPPTPIAPRTPAWRGIPEPQAAATPAPATIKPALPSGRSPGGYDPFVGPVTIREVPDIPENPARPNTITSPETAPAVDVNPHEAASRTALAQKMGQKLQQAGAAVEDVAKLPDDDPFWQTLEQSVRPGEKATRSKPPSPDTVHLAREYHQQFAGKQQFPIAKPAIPASLKGRSLDIAQKLKAEMSQ